MDAIIVDKYYQKQLENQFKLGKHQVCLACAHLDVACSCEAPVFVNAGLLHEKGKGIDALRKETPAYTGKT